MLEGDNHEQDYGSSEPVQPYMGVWDILKDSPCQEYDAKERTNWIGVDVICSLQDLCRLQKLLVH